MFLFEQQINFSICWFMCCFKSNQIPNNQNQKYTKYTRTSSFKIQRMICYQTVKLLINQVLQMITLLCLISLLNNRILIGFDRGVQNKKNEEHDNQKFTDTICYYRLWRALV